MSNKNKTDLAEFKTWLQDIKMVSKSSSTVYASRVRKVLTRMETLHQDELDRVMETLIDDSFHSHMSCWNHFRDFCGGKGIELPSSTVKKTRKRSLRESDLPELVTLALLKVAESCGLRPQIMVGLKWKDVQMRGEADWWIVDPLEPSLLYMAPSTPMRILCDWANGEIDIEKERPLVPRIALSMVPMSKSGIKRAISGRKRNRLQ